MNRTTAAGNFPEETITTPGGYALRGTVYPDGCTRWASHSPCRWAYSIAYLVYETLGWVNPALPKPARSDVKGYYHRPRYCVYQNSRKKRDFNTQADALAYIDELRSE